MPMRTATGFRAACLALGIALLGSAFVGPRQDAGQGGVRGGTLRVLSEDVIDALDTAVLYRPQSAAIGRAYARSLYGYDLDGAPEKRVVPVPDIASGPAQISADRRTYTFTLRPGVRYAPPVNREVVAQDFITAIERFYVKDTLSPGPQWANLIAGATAFGAGEADTISGLAATDSRTLRITLDRPADDFLSMLARPNFAPVPKEHADAYGVGKRYDGHVVGTGPYKLAIYVPGETVILDRNPNWDPATDPLRKAWVDRIQIKLDIKIPSIQRAIDRGTADLSLTSHISANQLPALRADPERSGRLSVQPSGCQVFLVLGTHPKAGAIADVRVRRAVNYAIDKAAYRDAAARRYAPQGELASTILAPGSLGHRPYDLYPTPGGHGDPAKARVLLAEAGYPDGLTLGFASVASGRLAAANKVVRDSLARAGIDLKLKTYNGSKLWEESLQLPAKRLEHQLGLNGWCPDYLGDNARQAIVALYDGRLPPDASANFSEYQNPDVNRLIDRARAEPDPGRRAALWAETDQRIMQDAPMVPLVWENHAYLWTPRVHGWVYDPWTSTPDLTAPWLDPSSP
jgi:peptide/nickel transport system substrate-binding protein